MGWRWAFAATAALAVIIATLAPAGSLRSVSKARAASSGERLAPIHLLALAATLASAAALGVVAFLVSYAVDIGLREDDAGLLLGLASLLAVVSRIGLGPISTGAAPIRCG